MAQKEVSSNEYIEKYWIITKFGLDAYNLPNDEFEAICLIQDINDRFERWTAEKIEYETKIKGSKWRK